MNRYVFTFGSGQKHEGYYQVIEAPDMQQARNLMFEHHGRDWCNGFSEEEWLKMLNDPTRPWPMEYPLRQEIIWSEEA